MGHQELVFRKASDPDLFYVFCTLDPIKRDSRVSSSPSTAACNEQSTPSLTLLVHHMSSSCRKSVTFGPSDRVTLTQESSGDDEDYSEESEDEKQGIDESKEETGAGWSDAISRLLNCRVRGKNFILTKAKKDRDIVQHSEQKTGTGFEVVKESGEKELVVSETPTAVKENERKERKDAVSRKLRQKGADADLILESRLNAIATRGVVQLFNAVNEQRSSVSKKLQAAGSSETRKDRVLAAVSKGEFLDRLKQKNEPEDKFEEPVKKKKKGKEKEEKLKFKEVFSDDFEQREESV